MMIEEKPSYLGGDPVASFDTSYNEDYPPKMTDRIMPPTAQPDLVSVRPKLPRPDSDTESLPYTYRAEIAPYTDNYMIATHPLSYGNLHTTDDYKASMSSGFSIVAGAVAGYFAEPMIVKKGYPKGYGAIFGALLGNAFHQVSPYYGVDAEKTKQALYGATVPAIPLAIAFGLKKNMNEQIAGVIGALSLLAVLGK
jgi:hypothetical protein